MISSSNEWDKLSKVILGSSEKMNWSITDPDYSKLVNRPGSNFGSGPVPNSIIYDTEKALNYFQKQLELLDVEVIRPKPIDYQSSDSFGNYCPRDTVLVIGDKVILTPTKWKKRRDEWASMLHLFPTAVTVDDPNAMFDAANIIRCNNDIIYLISYSGNEAGADWLERYLGPEYTVHRLRNVYNGMHLDTTIVPLREGLVMLNRGRMSENDIPRFMKNWDKIWIYEEDIISTASKWIGMNLLSYNENLVFCDSKQINIINKLKKHRIEIIGVTLPHAKYLMGGHHCVTLDLKRG
jgi:N-dimethylarginine dimethylaminohydrolase